jgi:hypothetical protein
LEFASSLTSKVISNSMVSFPGGAGRIGVVRKINEDESIARAALLAKENKYTILCAGLNVSSLSPLAFILVSTLNPFLLCQRSFVLFSW